MKKADLVVCAGKTTRACLESVYRFSGDSLGRLIVVHDPPADASLRQMHPELVLLSNERALGVVASWNRGLFISERDVVLLESSALVTAGWLETMLEVLHGSDRIASVTPSSIGSCLLLRHYVFNMIGGLDPALTHPLDAEADWILRAQCWGLRSLRAGRASVQQPPSTSWQPAELLRLRYPQVPVRGVTDLEGPELFRTAAPDPRPPSSQSAP